MQKRVTNSQQYLFIAVLSSRGSRVGRGKVTTYSYH